ncbi:hypothetical protein [Ekhidna sp.]|uniref:hypothetical protein n=1 Tax=Ekhidna sp. TaxID=2608089 RepID=UPI003C7A8FE6
MGISKEHSLESIMRLSKSELLQGGKFKDFLNELVPIVCSSLSAYKTSFWLYRPEKDEFECIQSFDRETNNSSTDKAPDSIAFPAFYKKLKEELFIYVDSSDDSKDIEEFVVDHVLKNRLRSWAGIQVWNDSRLFGVLAVEWKANKDFVSQDQLVMVTAASMISQCYDALIRLKEDFLHRNEVNTLKVEEKEKEKLAKKLSDHAFYTSHSIRHPLSTILALIDLIKLNWESRETYEELLQQLKIETMNLDDAIRVMTAKIELD